MISVYMLSVKRLTISILNDNPDSWIGHYSNTLASILKTERHIVKIANKHSEVEEGDICFLLGCEKIASKSFLAKNRHNLVVHESNLPNGKGWSPLTWQILEGKNEIPICIFEAAESVDSGKIYFKDMIRLGGHELIDEIRTIQGKKTIELCLKTIQAFPSLNGNEQASTNESFYPKRTPEDSKVDAQKSIKELFNQFRVADNERYPIFFVIDGYRYKLEISKMDTPRQT